MLSKTTYVSQETVSFDVSRLTEQAKQELLDFYQFLLQRYGTSKSESAFAPSLLESSDAPSVYNGPPLSLEDMDRTITVEAGKHV